MAIPLFWFVVSETSQNYSGMLFLSTPGMK